MIFEAKNYYGGHLYSWQRDGFTWDDGPHISFTMNQYVKDLFAECVNGEYEQVAIKATNYSRAIGSIHPAQTSLWQIPEPLRTQCLESFLETVKKPHTPPKNYEQWLHQAMGPVFADNFPAAYTRKYWTCEPRDPRHRLDRSARHATRESTTSSTARRGRCQPGCTTSTTARRAIRRRADSCRIATSSRPGRDIRYGKKLEQVDFGKQIAALRRRHGDELRTPHLDGAIPVPDQVLD